MDLGIAGRTALVSGAAGAIGLATARVLAHESAKLFLTDTDEGGLHDSIESLRSEGATVDGAVADLTDQRQVDDVVTRAGEPDIVVHAAGITGAKGDPLELDDDAWRDAWEVDFMSAVRVARAAIPPMKGRGWGRMVFVASENAVQPYADEMPYNVAKAALVNLTKGLGQVVAPAGVLVNVVSPAFIETDMTDQMMEQRAEERGETMEDAVASFLDEERPHLVLERRGQPEEVAAVIALLCSTRASFVVGSNYRVDGGSVLAMNT